MSHAEYVPRKLLRLKKTGQTDGRTPDRYITLTARTASVIMLFDWTMNSEIFSIHSVNMGSFVAGKFRFRFWDFGEWRTITIDDRIPTVKDRSGKNELIFGRNSDQPHEFWVPLMEKAFVK